MFRDTLFTLRRRRHVRRRSFEGTPAEFRPAAAGRRPPKSREAVGPDGRRRWDVPLLVGRRHGAISTPDGVRAVTTRPCYVDPRRRAAGPLRQDAPRDVRRVRPLCRVRSPGCSGSRRCRSALTAGEPAGGLRARRRAHRAEHLLRDRAAARDPPPGQRAGEPRATSPTCW